MYDPLADNQGRFPVRRGLTRGSSRNGVYQSREAVAPYPFRGNDGLTGLPQSRRKERRVKFLHSYPLAMAWIGVSSVAAIVVELVR